MRNRRLSAAPGESPAPLRYAAASPGAIPKTVASGLRLSNTHRVTVHDKFMVIDGESVETGSFNYTTSAARYNSENAVVMWHVPVVAQAYQQHWQNRFNQGRPWSGQASN